MNIILYIKIQEDSYLLIHVVNKGDVLWRIAEHYEANINEIIEINGLTNPNLLIEGQSLLIPSPGIFYTVRYGDTLWEIANRFSIPFRELMSINRIINPNLIYPGVTLTIPQERRPPIEVNGISYVFGETDIPLLSNSINYLTYLTPFSYIAREDGSLFSINDRQAIQLAIFNNVIPIMSVVNYSYYGTGTDAAHTIFNNIEVMNNLINNIISTMNEKGYRGVKFDFDNILPEDREAYNNFLHVATSRLHAEGFYSSTSLIPKFSDLEHLAYDYEAHGRIVDFVLLKVYNWGANEGPPGPITPVNDLRRVLDYATSLIPSDKIFIGLPLYAKDWVIPYISGQEAEIISVQTAMNRAQRNNVQIQYDEISRSPFYYYRDESGRMHESWFEDPRSIQAKFDVVKEYGIRGITYWNLAYEFIQNWHLLEDSFIIVKD
jgi:spore germination protein